MSPLKNIAALAALAVTAVTAAPMTGPEASKASEYFRTHNDRAFPPSDPTETVPPLFEVDPSLMLSVLGLLPTPTPPTSVPSFIIDDAVQTDGSYTTTVANGLTIAVNNGTTVISNPLGTATVGGYPSVTSPPSLVARGGSGDGEGSGSMPAPTPGPVFTSTETLFDGLVVALGPSATTTVPISFSNGYNPLTDSAFVYAASGTTAIFPQGYTYVNAPVMVLTKASTFIGTGLPSFPYTPATICPDTTPIPLPTGPWSLVTPTTTSSTKPTNMARAVDTAVANGDFAVPSSWLSTYVPIMTPPAGFTPTTFGTVVTPVAVAPVTVKGDSYIGDAGEILLGGIEIVAGNPAGVTEIIKGITDGYSDYEASKATAAAAVVKREIEKTIIVTVTSTVTDKVANPAITSPVTVNPFGVPTSVPITGVPITTVTFNTSAPVPTGAAIVKGDGVFGGAGDILKGILELAGGNPLGLIPIGEGIYEVFTGIESSEATATAVAKRDPAPQDFWPIVSEIIPIATEVIPLVTEIWPIATSIISDLEGNPTAVAVVNADATGLSPPTVYALPTPAN